MITCFDPTGASPPSIGGLLLCPRLGAVGIGGRAGEDTGPYGVRLSDMVHGNRCRGTHRAPVLPQLGGRRQNGRTMCAPTTAIRYGGICCTTNNATTIKFRGQVVASFAERQRTPTARLKTGGTLSRYHPLSESHRRRVRSTKPKSRTSLPKLRRVLGFLGGSE